MWRKVQVLCCVLLFCRASSAQPPAANAEAPPTPEQRMRRVQAAKDRAKGERDLPVLFVQKGISPERRERRNHRFDDKYGQPITDNLADMGSRHIFTHEQSRMPGMPGPQSDVVVIGTVESAQAFLSADQQNIYSEFGMRVQSVQKHPRDIDLHPGEVIAVLRRGGAVVFASGRRVSLRINGQTLPVVGGQYVLFLKSEPGLDAYSMLTGYALENGISRSLDTSEQFVAYDGLPQARFLRLLGEATNQ
jgi:hypothetical protein